MNTPTSCAPLRALLGANAAATHGGRATPADASNEFDTALLALLLGAPDGASATPAAPAVVPADARPPEDKLHDGKPGRDADPVGIGAPTELPAALLAMLRPAEPAQMPGALSVAEPSLPTSPASNPAGIAIVAGPPGAEGKARTAKPVPDSTTLLPAGVENHVSATQDAKSHPVNLLESRLVKTAEALPLHRESPADLAVPAPAAPPPATPSAQVLAPAPGEAPGPAQPLAGDPKTPAWREGFAERVSLHVRDGKTEARLTLHPADLGPIDVRIRVEEGAASLQFDARHPETRQAIEAALPRLREMLADGGLQLGGAQIGHRNGGQSGEAPSGPAAAPAATASDPEATAVVERTVIIPARGRVDLYA